MINIKPDLSPVVAALCRMYGRRVEGGWYEVYIPAHIVAELPSTPGGEVQRVNSTEPGWRWRYRYSRVIDGQVISVEKVEPGSPPIYQPEPEPDSPPHHIDEWA